MASTAPIAADPMQRADELLREMTLEEKAMQLLRRSASAARSRWPVRSS